jgi:hypothetical protein
MEDNTVKKYALLAILMLSLSCAAYCADLEYQQQIDMRAPPVAPTNVATKQYVDDADALSYHAPSGGIPSTDLSPGVQSSLAKADTALQAESDPLYSADKAGIALKTDIPDVSGKADKAVPATAGNLAALDAAGNLIDSGTQPGVITSPTKTQVGMYTPPSGGASVPRYRQTFAFTTQPDGSTDTEIPLGFTPSKCWIVDGILLGKSDAETEAGTDFQYPLGYTNLQDIIGFHVKYMDSKLHIFANGFTSVPGEVTIEYID